MAFITKEQAEQFLTTLYNDGWADTFDSFEEFVENIESCSDEYTPDVVYAYHVYMGNV